MKILFMMSGSIACAKATGLISSLVKKQHKVKVVASESALEFVGKATLEGLSGNKVIDSTFEEGEMMEHIHLSRWADRIVLAPATANTLNKLAAGIADDVLTTTWVAAQQLGKPIYIAPAMNGMMWGYPATQNSIKKLQQWGAKILSPQPGDLACGESDVGRLMEVEDLEMEILKSTPAFNKQKILITGGGTREYIDGVRYIGNLSSGRTSSEMADHFSAEGYMVDWLGAKTAVHPQLQSNIHHYDSFIELQDSLKSLLSKNHYDLVIHAAAVSDYSVESVTVNGDEKMVSKEMKLPTEDHMSLKLKKNPKLIQELKNWSKNVELKLLGFKLTNTKDLDKRKQAVDKLFRSQVVDYVAQNDLTEITAESHPFKFYKNNTESMDCDSIQTLCDSVIRILETTK